MGKFKLSLSTSNLEKLKKFSTSGTYYRLIKKSVNSKFVKSEVKSNQKTKQYEVTLIQDVPKSAPQHLEENNLTNDYLQPNECFSPLASGSSETSSSCNNNYNEEERKNECKFLNESESEDEDKVNYNLNEMLRKWAVSFNISHIAITGLLSILQLCNIPNLPKSSRTLLRTPREIKIIKMGNGSYWHNGLERCISNLLSDITSSTKLELSFNIDGLPIYNSSKMEFWPILCLINNRPNINPFVVGIYCGTGKPPSARDFLTPFVEELKLLLENGISINARNCSITIRCFICDTPARSFVKGVVNFNAYSGCTRCTVIGEYSQESHRMSFPCIDAPKRTDESFRQRIDADHHKENSPLEELPINMVDDFPIGDSLHLLHLGIMKRCLIGWREGRFKKYYAKWSMHDINSISNFICHCQIPSEIHRAVRGLDSLAFWKATEFRTFLLYIGPVVLKDFLRVDVYQHFLMFFCGVTICASNNHSINLEVAESLLKKYIERYIDLYGNDSITSNVHSLCHLVDDVRRFGELESFTAYPYESMLFQLKRLLRTGNNPLAQVAKRITEMESCHNSPHKLKQLPIVKRKITCSKLKNLLPQCDNFFAYLELSNGLIFTNENKNKWMLTKDCQIVCIKCITMMNNILHIFGSSLKKHENFFEIPITSCHLNIYVSTGEENHMELFSLDNIRCKLVAIQYHKKKVFIPLLHTYKE